MPEPIGRAEDLLPGHAMACSLQGIPYRDQGLYPNLTRSSEPASHFPSGQDPQVHKEAPLLISSFQRVAQLLTDCNRLFTRLQLFENTNRSAFAQLRQSCGKRSNLWETTAWSGRLLRTESKVRVYCLRKVSRGEPKMASPARKPLEQKRPTQPQAGGPSTRDIEDFLDEVMVSVSASLDKMTPEERERAVIAAERAVSHLPHS